MKYFFLSISILILTSCESFTDYTNVKESELLLYTEIRKTLLPLLPDSTQILLPDDAIYMSETAQNKIDSFYRMLSINKLDKISNGEELIKRPFVIFIDGSVKVGLSYSKDRYFGDRYENCLFYPGNVNSTKQLDDGVTTEIDSSDLNHGWKYITITYRNL